MIYVTDALQKLCRFWFEIIFKYCKLVTAFIPLFIVQQSIICINQFQKLSWQQEPHQTLNVQLFALIKIMLYKLLGCLKAEKQRYNQHIKEVCFSTIEIKEELFFFFCVPHPRIAPSFSNNYLSQKFKKKVFWFCNHFSKQ